MLTGLAGALCIRIVGLRLSERGLGDMGEGSGLSCMALVSRSSNGYRGWRSPVSLEGDRRST